MGSGERPSASGLARLPVCPSDRPPSTTEDRLMATASHPRSARPSLPAPTGSLVASATRLLRFRSVAGSSAGGSGARAKRCRTRRPARHRMGTADAARPRGRGPGITPMPCRASRASRPCRAGRAGRRSHRAKGRSRPPGQAAGCRHQRISVGTASLRSRAARRCRGGGSGSPAAGGRRPPGRGGSGRVRIRDPRRTARGPPWRRTRVLVRD